MISSIFGNEFASCKIMKGKEKCKGFRVVSWVFVQNSGEAIFSSSEEQCSLIAHFQKCLLTSRDGMLICYLLCGRGCFNQKSLFRFNIL